MALKKAEEYIASLKSLRLEANVMGKKTQDLPDHPLVTPSVRAVATTFDCAHNDETSKPFPGTILPYQGKRSIVLRICTKVPKTWSKKCSCRGAVET